MEQRPNRRDCGYYGTGRRRETDRSHLPMILALLGLMIAANLITIAVHSRQSSRSSEDNTQTSEAETMRTAYPVRGNTQAQQEWNAFGMEVSELDEAERRYWALPEGVIVRSVDAGSKADSAGILAGDVILGLGDAAVTDIESFTAALERCADGQSVSVTLYRSGERYALELPSE